MLQAIPSDIGKGKSNSFWTKEIKRVFIELGHKEGFKVCAHGVDTADAKEWLYDLVWYRDDENGRLESVPLVLESEWEAKYEGIKYDFEKLLLARTVYKVMIFQGEIESHFEELKESILAFKDPGASGTFILAGFDGERFEFDIRVARLSEQGELSVKQIG